MAAESQRNRVSVIVVNWNGHALLRECLESLCRQTAVDKEILLVDNGSTDLSLQLVMEHFPEVRTVALAENCGFAIGNLEGLKAAQGEFVALMNNDACADESWIENLLSVVVEDERIGICSSKIVNKDGTDMINSAGTGITMAGVGFDRGAREGTTRFCLKQFVFGACGAAVLYRRKMLDEIGFLDDDFFLYDEDTDLNFRAQLAGWKCVYVPSAVVHHKGNATVGRLSDTHVYYHTRNLEFVWIKNMPLGLMLRFAHHKVLQEIGSFCYLCLRHRRWRPFFRAKMDAMRMLPKMWKKRRMIQARRSVSNAYLRSLMTSMFTLDFVLQKLRQLVKG
jgi:GT2 family glycosyltransferase